MELTLKSEKLSLFNIENFDDRKVEFSLSTALIEGRYSNNALIYIRDGFDNDSYISMEINKNEAIYLRNFLSSFIEEKHIDISAED